MNLKILPYIKQSAPIASEADVKSPRNWMKELYGDSPGAKTPPKFIHAEKKVPLRSSQTVDADLSRILEDVLEEKTPKS